MSLALLAALAGMFGYGAGSILQAVGARRAHGLAVMRQPTYLAGLATDAAAWIGSLLALATLPLFLVQSILAGSLGVTVLLARMFLGTRLRPRDGVAVAVVVAALATIALAAGPQASASVPAGFSMVMLAGLVLTVAVAAAVYSRGGSTALAVLSGIAFSGAALSARTVHIQSTAQVLTQPLAWAILGFGALGILAYARALERGSVGPATAVLWAVEVVVPGVIGIVVLGDTVRAGWAAPAALAVCATIAACVVLAGSPAQEVEPT